MKSKALVVEDSKYWQHILQKNLHSEGLDVVLVRDAPAAIGELLNTTYRLVTIDLRLNSSTIDDNRDGRYLLTLTDERNIPAIVLSAYLPPLDEVIIDTQKYPLVRFLDKAGFDPDHFRSLVNNVIIDPNLTASLSVNNLLYEVVRALLRHRLKPNAFLEQQPSVLELSQTLQLPTTEFISQLREDFESVLQALLFQAEQEELSLQKVNRAAFPDSGDYIRKHIAQLHQQKQNDSKAKLLSFRSRRMRNLFVIEARYGSNPQTVKNLASAMACSQATLYRWQRLGVSSITSSLLQQVLSYIQLRR